jgi:hypothetical protein
MIYKTLRRKLMITQREPQLKPRMNVSDPEGYGAPALTSGTFHVTVKRYEHEVGHKST